MSMSKQCVFLVVCVLIVLMTADARRFNKNYYRFKNTNLMDVKTKIRACQGKFLCDYMSTSTMCTWECYDNDKVCNGVRDCDDGADEKCPSTPAPPACPQCEAKCSDREFTCKNGTCIPIEKICDGTNDCGDNGDESGPICNQCTCPDDQYQCTTSKECIPRSLLCDGNLNCTDGSDEPDNCRCKINTAMVSFCGDSTPDAQAGTLAKFEGALITPCINACRGLVGCVAVVQEVGTACYLRSVSTVVGAVEACAAGSFRYHLCDLS